MELYWAAGGEEVEGKRFGGGSFIDGLMSSRYYSNILLKLKINKRSAWEIHIRPNSKLNGHIHLCLLLSEAALWDDPVNLHSIATWTVHSRCRWYHTSPAVPVDQLNYRSFFTIELALPSLLSVRLCKDSWISTAVKLQLQNPQPHLHRHIHQRFPNHKRSWRSSFSAQQPRRPWPAQPNSMQKTSPDICSNIDRRLHEASPTMNPSTHAI